MPKTVAFLGPEGTYTDEACYLYAPDAEVAVEGDSVPGGSGAPQGRDAAIHARRSAGRLPGMGGDAT